MTLELEGLTKVYKDKTALDDVSFSFTPGIYGLLGPNGAGKSTMMNLISDNLTPSKGRVLLDGRGIDELGSEYRKLLGYMPQQQGFYESFSARMFLVYMAELKGLRKKEAKKQIENLLEIVHLSHVADKKIGGFSGGMKQRVLLAQALLGNPKLLILDEPTAGLDPAGRDEILGLVSKMHRELGITILLVSHSMEDVAEYVDRIIVMNHGAVMFDALPKQVFAHYKELEAVGLAAPQVTYLVHELAERGLPVDTQATTAKEAAQTILSALREKNVI